MRKYYPLLLVSLLLHTAMGFSQKQKPCWDTAMTQFELNNCAGKDLKLAESEMERDYQEILRQNQNDEAFVHSFEAAQRAWEVYRDAEIKAIYPHSDTPDYGSVFPMCLAIQRTELTRQRIKQLKQWIVGIPEGDVCAGSIPNKQN